MAAAQDNDREVTRLLHRWASGDESAEELLLPLVYEELRRLAGVAMRGERAGHTLQPTALVHQAYLRLVRSDVPWQDRVHFFAVAARTMRRVLVDHAKARWRLKRGAGVVVVPLVEALVEAPEEPPDILSLDRALERLFALDERKARAVELHYFGGLSYDDVARALELSRSTVTRDLRLARAWLYRELVRADADPTAEGRRSS